MGKKDVQGLFSFSLCSYIFISFYVFFILLVWNIQAADAFYDLTISYNDQQLNDFIAFLEKNVKF